MVPSPELFRNRGERARAWLGEYGLPIDLLRVRVPVPQRALERNYIARFAKGSCHQSHRSRGLAMEAKFGHAHAPSALKLDRDFKPFGSQEETTSI